MSTASPVKNRTIGFLGATSIGVGAMVGGGILALAGVAFAVSGPSAILAFILNGLIALITALSFAEMAAANPQNGGTYTYAKKVFTVQVAFGVGWVVWFASLVAAVLYALGFGAFASFALQQIPYDGVSALIGHTAAPTVLGLMALSFYTIQLTGSNGGGGAFANIAKLSVFAILIAGGLAATVQMPFSEIKGSFEPFFGGGFTGLLAAMGFTFIALQGFDLIASAAGEIKEPAKTIPKAMVATLAVGLTIYLPLLFVVMGPGIPAGESLMALSAENPETIIAIAAQNFLGAFGFWFVLVAGIFSMLSALQANLFAASRIALSMANDRTLTHHLSVIDKKRGTPVKAILTTCGIVGLLILVLPDVAAAGAASSLIFLITFALGNIIMMLMRTRTFTKSETFRVPFFPYLPIIGMLACFGLALFQAVAVPAAGIISLIWLVLGSVLFVSFFIQRARVIDATDEALDPDIIRLRGLNPLVLLPISNPANAESMVFVANSLAPPVVGRVLLLSIVTPSDDGQELTRRLNNNRDAMQQALMASFDSGMRPDALTTIASEPWEEIERVTKVHQCRSMLLGLSTLSELQTTQNLERLIQRVHCDVVVFRQPYPGWKISQARKVLIPVAGYGSHDALRARVAASLWRTVQPEFTFVQILPPDTSEKLQKSEYAKLSRFAARIIPQTSECRIILSSQVRETIVDLTHSHDLVIMGLGRSGRNNKVFGQIPLEMAEKTDTALIFISHK
ncbi:MAG: amino acid permease [Balneolales bacterium]|nr:amino acid permease [Balneolales bacterium]